MTWLLALNVVGLVVAVSLVLESFRPKPMWVRPEKFISPRQRRWFGIALIFIFAGSTVNWLNMAGETNHGLLVWGLMFLGMALLMVGIVKGPTDEELERRARLLQGERS